ncbi:MAG: pyruvate, phosphate dikinase [Candidatus Obscuribacterales bacterium]|nr:pyruvate, phosphate dikinase [Candidatus Obscuribacterales bacterium]
MPQGSLPRLFLFEEAHKFFSAGDGDPATNLASRRDQMKSILGGKGAGLAEMTASGVQVPPGLTITTANCLDYYKQGKMPDGLLTQVLEKLAKVEENVGRKLGDPSAPLLVSVRSGAKFSMPGMMDTILNLGLNSETVNGLAAITANPRFAFDSYRRFIQMYGNVVLGIDKEEFEHCLTKLKQSEGVKLDSELSASALKSLVASYKEVVLARTGKPFPEDVQVQLASAIEAVFLSWNNPRAIYYRDLNKIDHSIGTAVTVQSMVFGNLDDRSATGVCFTRNPSTGEKALFGEYLIRAQGEDVVAGIRTPDKIASLAQTMPDVMEQLSATVQMLESHYRDVQDIEFTVESGKLYILQTRAGKRTAEAAVRIAVEMFEEGIIGRNEALMRVDPREINSILLPSFDASAKSAAAKGGRLLAVGLNASPGAAIGEVVFDPDEAEQRGKNGEKVILVRVETCPDDIHGIVPAQGVVTCRGGMTSHAAVVARGMGKPCVAGCEAMRIDAAAETFTIPAEEGAARVVRKGEVISIDGSTGEIFVGAIETRVAGLTKHLSQLLDMADAVRKLGIRANADTPFDAQVARRFGAEGIGLCRTEHMFMSQERLPVVQEMILADGVKSRMAALDKLLPMQRQDFIGLFEAMDGLPVTIRLLDPPLHEFLPRKEELVEEVRALEARLTDLNRHSRRKVRNAVGRAETSLAEKRALIAKVEQLHEVNPMMGLRGCRLGLVFPEINVMQVRAIFEAAIDCARRGIKAQPEVMIPLIGDVQELNAARAVFDACAEQVMQEAGLKVDYKFGTMIEVPRAALTADEIAEVAEFFSFGTNDLTQMTYAFSRDDAEGKFLQHYLEGVDVLGQKRKIFKENPFVVLDRKGVGKLMRMAVDSGRSVRQDIKLGICGEHGGDPSSIAFAHELGLTYVSSSPYRVPIARLAAAQAQIEADERGGQTTQRDK